MKRLVGSSGIGEPPVEARSSFKEGRRLGPFAAVGNGLLLAPAQRHGRQLHITSDGRPGYKERYDEVGNFVKVGKSLHLAVARLDGHGFHITPDGKRAYDAEFSHVEDFEKVGSRWLATVSIGNGQTYLRWFRIDRNGKRFR